MSPVLWMSVGSYNRYTFHSAAPPAPTRSPPVISETALSGFRRRLSTKSRQRSPLRERYLSSGLCPSYKVAACPLRVPKCQQPLVLREGGITFRPILLPRHTRLGGHMGGLLGLPVPISSSPLVPLFSRNACTPLLRCSLHGPVDTHGVLSCM